MESIGGGIYKKRYFGPQWVDEGINRVDIKKPTTWTWSITIITIHSRKSDEIIYFWKNKKSWNCNPKERKIQNTNEKNSYFGLFFSALHWIGPTESLHNYKGTSHLIDHFFFSILPFIIKKAHKAFFFIFIFFLNFCFCWGKIFLFLPFFLRQISLSN